MGIISFTMGYGHTLPPLTALRAFEAAARCGSFVLAGKELSVSSAAISLQIKTLEDHLGKKLFVRKGNRISLTDAGEMMYPKLARAFEEMSEAARIVRSDTSTRQLVVSVLPALAELWFLPKAITFTEETGISLDVRVQEDPIDFEREAIDIRLTYGSALYPGYRETRLFSDVAIPVCAPWFCEAYPNMDEALTNVPDNKFIHNKWGSNYASEPLWSDWRRQVESDATPFSDAGLTINDLTFAIATAKRGAGIALVPSVLAKTDLASGLLVIPSKHALKMKKDYVCVIPHARFDTSAVRQFSAHLALNWA
ncbi:MULTISPECIES: LysR family transcriptional regulator [unclassified Ruegeria]|uniref:LysR family transcriptional regulator n=1 Tax=unclassified Ruegeria TaxID=2625375 RepID=UPI001488CF68|nr:MULTISPECIES: LysR family transcriptional regulator [unclassified Ruegeria]NOD34550.1 LysR family transcriptional regulator [Ruegeria sp. HKCCD7296]NOD47663.1 LysR family transcriptional regulator [Ruegeria sp. HKCCD5849]NOD52674.1 LysR family transcriptional regulator [Ruegeria sp. HKCCD5851]NOD66093.1 LysR family transcriptional regulator [Ruegeria sp. HKCCD7303]NOE40226.1 LysR family transcriptional regulator [Ruegeria sp. HKCCD7319]